MNPKEYPIVKELLDCFNPRREYYIFLRSLCNFFKIDIRKELENKEEFDKNLTLNLKNYAIDLERGFHTLRLARNIITHSFDEISENNVRNLLTALHHIKRSLKDNIHIDIHSINRIIHACNTQLYSIHPEERQKYIEQKNRVENKIEYPEVAIVQDLKQNFKMEIIGKYIEILDGKGIGQKGIFVGWDGTKFRFKRKDGFLSFPSIHRTIKIKWNNI